MASDTRDIILETIERALDAQLRAIRRLRAGTDSQARTSRAARRSHMSIVEDILQSAGAPLHVSEIIARAQARFAQSLDRESLVSALTKRVARRDRFVRTAPNTFALRSQPAKEARPAP
jgi:hypothetical protein